MISIRTNCYKFNERDKIFRFPFFQTEKYLVCVNGFIERTEYESEYPPISKCLSCKDSFRKITNRSCKYENYNRL